MTFINGVIFGSTVALAGVLGIIVFLRWVMSLDAGLDQSVVQNSLPLGTLLRDIVVFGLLAVVAGVTFVAELRRKSWRGVAQAVLAFGVLATLVYFLADEANRLRDLALLCVVAVCCIAFWQIGRALGLWQGLRHWLEDDD